MKHGRVIAGATTLALAVGGTGAAVAAGGAAPKTTTIKAVSQVKVKVNRYIQDGLRWNRDVYTVRSGGTLRIVNNAPDSGPHTFTVVKPKDLPKTTKQIMNCKICGKLGRAHGADPTSDAPPKFAFLENGVGSETPPNVDRPGDSALLEMNKGGVTKLKVTAKKGTTLSFICLIHPWMQAKVLVK
jgi:hypothetical protein